MSGVAPSDVSAIPVSMPRIVYHSRSDLFVVHPDGSISPDNCVESLAGFASVE
jgi:hypothetical protein